MPEPFSADALRALAEAMAQPPQTQDTASRTADPHAIGPWPYLAMGTGSGADLLTSLAAIRGGARELNPLLAHGGVAGHVAVKAGGTAAIMALMRYLAEHGHPTLAKGIGYGGGAGFGALPAHNATVGR